MINRIRSYGPTLVLLATTLLVLLAGPSLVRQLAYAQAEARLGAEKKALATNPALDELSRSFRRVAEVVEPSVVHIERLSRTPPQRINPFEEMRRRFFNMPDSPLDQVPRDPREHEMDQYNVPQPEGNGSGWVYDVEGHIVTNNHVVEGADQIKVKFHDGSERFATVVATDPRTDVAVLKVEGGNLHPASLATENVEKGDIVFAFGSPLHFEFTMSQGIVSAKGRTLGILSRRDASGGIIAGYEDFIQTDAAINPGNSGGPLANIYGQVIGMNTAIASRTGTNTGLGFAIPINMVRDVVDQIIEHGKVTRGFLGIAIKELDPKMARTFGYEGEGVLVESAIEGTPAEKAGIKRGDIIVKLEDQPIKDVDHLRSRVARYRPGTRIKLEVFRDGAIQQFEVELTELPSSSIASNSSQGPSSTEDNPEAAELLRKLGIESATTFTAELAERIEMPFAAGVIVRTVRPASVAASQGIGPRTIITDVMGVPVASIEELVTELGKHDLARGIRVSVSDLGPDGLTSRFVLLELPNN